MTYWAVAVTHPQGERRALEHLARQDFTSYAPIERVTVIRRSKRIDTTRMMFPRYIFVQIQDQWHRLLSTFGIASVILSGLKPAKVPDTWITDCKAFEQLHLATGQLPPRRRFRPGETVLVREGLFEGRYGIYQGQTARQREVVLLHSLGRVELRPGDL